jgi:hypothetical protein
MALIECPDCHTHISDQAPACPHCGKPMGAGAAQPQFAQAAAPPPPPPPAVAAKPKRRGCFIGGCLSLLAVVVFLYLLGSSVQSKNPTVPVSDEDRVKQEAAAQLVALKDWSDLEAAGRLCQKADAALTAALRKRCGETQLGISRAALKDKKIGPARKAFDLAVGFGASKEAQGDLGTRLKKAEEKIDHDSKVLARQFYGKQLRQKYLDQNLDIKVTVSGKESDRIVLQFALFNDVWANKMQKGDLLTEMKKFGFKRVELTDGYRYQIYWDL